MKPVNYRKINAQAEQKERIRSAFHWSVFFAIVIVVFLIFLGESNENLLKASREVTRLIELKLSKNDVISLNDRKSRQWVTVRMIEADGKKFKVKVRPLHESVMDFQMNIDGTLFNLFKLTDERQPIYELFKSADYWHLNRSQPLVIRMKINGVLIGFYIMEQNVYDQFRDNDGNYYLYLNSDTHRMRKLNYEVRHKRQNTLMKYFDKRQLASYFVFYTLFSRENTMDYGRMAFYYDIAKKKYTPYLTMASVITNLQRWEKNTPYRTKKGHFFKKMTKKNVKFLERKSRVSQYASLIDTVLTDIHLD